MSYETVLTECRGETGGILWVTLNRPEKLNALSMTLFGELREVFQQARTERSVRCIVITGAGRGFCAGADFTGGSPEGLLYAAQESPTDLGRSTLNESERTSLSAWTAGHRWLNGCAWAHDWIWLSCDLAVASTAALSGVKRGCSRTSASSTRAPDIGWRKTGDDHGPLRERRRSTRPG
jgi:1,4-dihydroxy-2-naphthoyl-CoA synthase